MKVAYRERELKQITGAHESWLSGCPTNLSNRDLSNLDLREYNFTMARLHGTDFSGSDISGAQFVHADLLGANFSGAILLDTNFYGADLHQVITKDAKLNWESRELVSRVLFSSIDSDDEDEIAERRAIAGLLLVTRDHCWPWFVRRLQNNKHWSWFRITRDVH